MRLQLAQLRKRCEQTEEEILSDLIDLGGIVHETPSYLGYLDRGSNVLAVAHMDCVNVPHQWRMDKAKTRAYTPRLDDRLGVHTLLDVLPALGIHCDLLLTSDEEIGQSTAQYFDSPKAYNWVVEFDRRGEDVVTYGLDSPDWLNTLRSVGCHVGQGSFSDICYLDTDACCVNFGVGYHHEHSTNCYVELSEYKRQLVRFSRLYRKYADVGFVQQPAVKTGRFEHYWFNAKKSDSFEVLQQRAWDSGRCMLCDDWLLASEYEFCSACNAAQYGRGDR